MAFQRSYKTGKLDGAKYVEERLDITPGKRVYNTITRTSPTGIKRSMSPSMAKESVVAKGPVKGK